MVSPKLVQRYNKILNYANTTLKLMLRRKSKSILLDNREEKYSFYIFEDGELKVYSPLQHSNIQFIDFDDLTPVTEESDCNEFYKYLDEEEYKDLINNDFLV